MDKRHYSTHEFSRLISRTSQSLRNWDKLGKLKPHHTGANGYRYYSNEQLKLPDTLVDESGVLHDEDKVIQSHAKTKQ